MKLCYFLDFALAQLVHTVFVASTFSTECTTVVNQIQNIEMVLENGEVQLGHYTVVATLAKYFHAVNLCLFG